MASAISSYEEEFDGFDLTTSVELDMALNEDEDAIEIFDAIMSNARIRGLSIRKNADARSLPEVLERASPSHPSTKAV